MDLYHFVSHTLPHTHYLNLVFTVLLWLNAAITHWWSPRTTLRKLVNGFTLGLVSPWTICYPLVIITDSIRGTHGYTPGLMCRYTPVGLVGTVNPAMVPHSNVGRAGIVTHVTFIHLLLTDTICRRSTHTQKTRAPLRRTLPWKANLLSYRKNYRSHRNLLSRCFLEYKHKNKGEKKYNC